MKRIIITGTSRGIGFEMVKLLAQQDCEILALSRNDQPVKELNLDNVTTFSFDLSSAEDLTKVEGFLKDNWKRVDVLINNAGKLVNKNFEEIALALNWKEAISIVKTMQADVLFINYTLVKNIKTLEVIQFHSV